MSALPEAVATKAKGLAEDLIDKAKDKIVEVGVDSDLNVVKPGSAESVFDIRITPGLIGTIGAVALAFVLTQKLGVVIANQQAAEGGPVPVGSGALFGPVGLFVEWLVRGAPR